MERHPEEQVRERAQPAPDTRAERAAEEHDTVEIALAARRAADQPPVAEGLARPQHHPVEAGGGDAQVDDLVVLVAHVHRAELAQQRRAVGEMEAAALGRRAPAREADPAEVPQRIAQERIPQAPAQQAQPRPLDRPGHRPLHRQPSLARNRARSTT